MEYWHTYKKIIIPVGLLILAVGIFALLKATKPMADLQQAEERFWPVATQKVSFQDMRPFVRAFGEIRAGREAELRAKVSGNVISVHEDLGDGASVRAGVVLVTIDDFDYVADRAEAQANLAEAKAKLDELIAVLSVEEKLLPMDVEQVTLSKHEVDRQAKLLKRKTVSRKTYDDALSALNERKQKTLVREQSIARLKTQITQAQSAVDKAATTLSKNEKNVSDTRLKAPFDGFLTDTDVTEGKQVSTSDRLGRLISLKNLEVAFHVPEADYARLTRLNPLGGREVTIFVRRGNDRTEYSGQIIRIDARVDATTGGRQVFAALSGLTLETDLRPGVFVEVSIPDELYQNIVVLPTTALHDNSYVYVVVDGRLQKRTIKVATVYNDNVLVADGLKTGDIVCLTRFAQMGDGAKVKVVAP